jgi:hypothetical protein
MSALPPPDEFRHALPLSGTGGKMQDGWTREGFDHGWPQTQPLAPRRIDSSGTQLYPHAFRIGLIVSLSALCWAMVLGLWHMAANALR